MKLVLATAIALCAGSAFAQHGGHTGHAAPAATPAAGVKGTGTVRSVDAKAGVVKLHHGPIPALKWPAMTMDFKASPQVIAAAKPGKKVSFVLNATGSEILSLQ